MLKIAGALGVSALLAGCATMPATAISHDYVTPDGKFWSIQISMYTGIPNTPQQTVMIVYSKFDKTPIAIVQGQTKTMSDELTASIVTAVTSLGTAAVSGNFVLQAAQANCPQASLCGTLVQVQNSAGATAGADAQSGVP